MRQIGPRVTKIAHASLPKRAPPRASISPIACLLKWQLTKTPDRWQILKSPPPPPHLDLAAALLKHQVTGLSPIDEPRG